MRRSASLPLSRVGITVEDDWDGFGQSLTGTGTTRFVGVRVESDEVTLPPEDLSTIPRWHLGPFYQHYLNAVVAGNALAVADDAVALIRGRRRSFTHGSADLPREDPVLLEVVGEIQSLAYASESLVLDAADVLARIPATAVDGVTDDTVVHQAASARLKCRSSSTIWRCVRPPCCSTSVGRRRSRGRRTSIGTGEASERWLRTTRLGSRIVPSVSSSSTT